MSAYGAIPTPEQSVQLVPRTYPLAQAGQALTVFPVRKNTVPQALVEYLAGIFNDTVEDGRTYPQQEKLSLDEFYAYFFAADCFVAIRDEPPANLTNDGLDRAKDCSIDTILAGRELKDAVLGMYYVKPNYPGRSSHNCNAGFVVPTHHRGLRIGATLGRSYLHYAPLLGYRGSVFNLVYVSNVASVKIWDALGFKRAGLIPKAGLLKNQAGDGEEYVDAIVFHYDFTTSH
ncbi:Spt10p [Sporobolomyces koalae]|uniref:Spt10p n=1 Tax=Sporobolomyces koalae TaxID=500713 RepID=UPI00316DC30F